MVAAKVWDSIDDLRGEAHYEILGVRKAATRAEIRRAFAVEARKHHPDKGGDDERFARVRKAYEVLSDPKARETYDALMGGHASRFVQKPPKSNAQRLKRSRASKAGKPTAMSD